MQIQIDYEQAKTNHMRADATKAVQFFLSGESGSSLVIFPQALNPMLKALEGLGVWEQALVVPYHDERNKPTYVVLKMSSGHPSAVELEDK